LSRAHPRASLLAGAQLLSGEEQEPSFGNVAEGGHLDTNRKLCGKASMLTKNGPVIFATLYTAGVILTIVVAILYARFDDEVPKAVLAVVQIGVTSGAIFSAWGLQEAKRAADRRDLIKDTSAAAREWSYLAEQVAGRVVAFAKLGQAKPSALTLLRPGLSQALDALRKLNVAHLPSTAAVSAHVRTCHNGTVVLAVIDHEIAAKRQSGRSAQNAFDANYKQLHRSRSDLLAALGQAPEAARPPFRPDEIEDWFQRFVSDQDPDSAAIDD
jgi:hypothetical protein